MACMTHHGDFARSSVRASPVENSVAGKLRKLVRRATDALAAQRRNGVDREIARLLAHSGGHFTDSMEREIMRKALGSDWSLPQ